VCTTRPTTLDSCHNLTLKKRREEERPSKAALSPQQFRKTSCLRAATGYVCFPEAHCAWRHGGRDLVRDRSGEQKKEGGTALCLDFRRTSAK